MATEKVANIKPGDRIPSVMRTVTAVILRADTVRIETDDGQVQTFDLAGDPAIDVEKK